MKSAKRLIKRIISRYTNMVEAPYVRRHPRLCTVCGYEGPFEDFGVRTQRLDARCPACGALERHRLLRLMFDQQPFVGPSDSVLHFAPEASVTRFVKPAAGRYVTADLYDPAVDLKLNIEALDLPDQEYSVILCSNVLEHVDDRKALAELFRVLKPGGVALLLVPICEAWASTYEDPAVDTDDGRELHFDQTDHVRYYGRDFRDRVRSAGFELGEFDSTPAQCARHALTRGGKIFVARRPVADG